MIASLKLTKTPLKIGRIWPQKKIHLNQPSTIRGENVAMPLVPVLESGASIQSAMVQELEFSFFFSVP